MLNISIYLHFHLPIQTHIKFIISLAQNEVLLALGNRAIVNIDPCNTLYVCKHHYYMQFFLHVTNMLYVIPIGL